MVKMINADPPPALAGMQRLLAAVLVASIALLFLLGPSPARALTCSEAVNPGDSLQTVAAKCGEASLKEQRTKTVEVNYPEGTRRTSTILETWTYDRGPDELVLSFVFENGNLTGIFSHGYGTAGDFSVDTCQNGAAIAVGDSTIETYLKCGVPLATEKKAGREAETRGDGTVRRTTIPVEEWTYRYGRDFPGYTVTFEDGIAVRIREREFGR